MQGIDTNILVRFLVKDDQKQFQQALELMKSIPIIYISPIVLVETIWVLTHCYNIPSKKQCEKLSKLLKMRRFFTDNQRHTLKAIRDYEKGFDFADAMIGHHNTFKCSTTWTFDKKAGQLSEFDLIK